MPATTAGPEKLAKFMKLSPVKQRIVHLIGRGYTSAEIAGHLTLGKKTVEYYRAAIIKQLGMSGGEALQDFAVNAGKINELQKIE